MSVNAPQMVSVVCPACRTQYSAPVQSVVDVGREPRLKTLLLQGRLNVGVCPSCGTAGMLSIPFIYHDPGKELLFCFVPQGMQMVESRRQRMIGEMSNAIINSLPAEQRKGYLLQPRIFLSLPGLLEAILEKDGITKEMLQAQQDKMQLIEELAQVVDDPLRLAGLVKENEGKIDYEFFSLLSVTIGAVERSEQPERLGKLTRLREKLLEQTKAGQEVAREETAIGKALEGLEEELTQEELLDRIVGIDPEYEDQILTVLISLARPLLDYQFFQLLTQRIESAEHTDDAERLKALRQKVLDMTQELDAELRSTMQAKVSLLSEIARSTDPQALIRQRIDEIDEAFMSVLQTSIYQNEEQHQHEAADALRAIREAIVDVLQENAPPAIRFVNQLLRTGYPDGTRQMLRENQSMLTADLLSVMDALIADLEDRGDAQTVERLKGIKAQAQLMM